MEFKIKFLALFLCLMSLSFAATTINSCTNLSNSGTYLLGGNLQGNTTIGSISACLFINSSDVTVSCDAGNQTFNITGNDSSSTVYGIYAGGNSNYTNISVSYCNVKNYTSGIYFDPASLVNGSFAYNNVSNNSAQGMFLEKIHNSTISYNTVFDHPGNTGRGLQVKGTNNTINGNNAYNNTNGLYFRLLHGSTLIGNNASLSSSHGITFDGAENNSVYVTYTYNNTGNGLNLENVESGNPSNNSFYGISSHSNAIGVNIDNANKTFLSNTSIYSNDVGLKVIGDSVATYASLINGELYGNSNESIFLSSSSTSGQAILNATNVSIYNTTVYLFSDLDSAHNSDAPVLNATNFGLGNASMDTYLDFSTLNIQNISSDKSLNTSHLLIGTDFVSFNSSAYSDFNTSAVIKIQVSSCDVLNYYRLLTVDLPTSASQISSSGNTFTPSFSSCSGGYVTFTVSGFSGYTAVGSASSSGGSEQSPPGNAGSVSLSTELDCENERIIVTATDDSGDPLSSTTIQVKVQGGSFLYPSDASTDSDGIFNFNGGYTFQNGNTFSPITNGLTYEFKGSNSPDYSDSSWESQYYSCEEELTCSVSSCSVDECCEGYTCNEESQYCEQIPLVEVMLVSCAEEGSSCDEANGLNCCEDLVCGNEGICETPGLNTFNISSGYNCIEGSISYTVRDQNGDCAYDYGYLSDNLSESNVEEEPMYALVLPSYCPPLTLYADGPLDQANSYETTFTKDGFENVTISIIPDECLGGADYCSEEGQTYVEGQLECCDCLVPVNGFCQQEYVVYPHVNCDDKVIVYQYTKCGENDRCHVFGMLVTPDERLEEIPHGVDCIFHQFAFEEYSVYTSIFDLNGNVKSIDVDTNICNDLPNYITSIGGGNGDGPNKITTGDNEFELPPETNVVITDPNGGETSFQNPDPNPITVVHNFPAAGNYTITVAGKGNVVGQQLLVVLEKPPEEESPFAYFSSEEGRWSLLLILLLLVGLYLYMRSRKTQPKGKRSKKYKGYKGK